MSSLELPFSLPEDLSGFLDRVSFTPPTVDEGLDTHHGLFRYYKLRRGVTVLVTGTDVRAVQYPTQDDLDAADAAYLGGHVHLLEPSAAAILIAAGYGAYLS